MIIALYTLIYIVLGMIVIGAVLGEKETDNMQSTMFGLIMFLVAIWPIVLIIYGGGKLMIKSGRISDKLFNSNKD